MASFILTLEQLQTITNCLQDRPFMEVHEAMNIITSAKQIEEAKPGVKNDKKGKKPVHSG